MHFELTIDMARTLKERLEAGNNPKHSDLIANITRSLGYRTDSILLDIDGFDDDAMEILYLLAKEKRHNYILGLINTIRGLRKDIRNTKVKGLRALVEGLRLFLVDGYIDGWLYILADGILSPSLVDEICYTQGDKHTRESVAISLCLNARENDRRGSSDKVEKSLRRHSIRINEDWCGYTIPEMLARNGIYHETPELKAEYEAHLAAFSLFQPMISQQFICNGPATMREGYSTTKVSIPPGGFKCVNDEDLNNRCHIETRPSKFWMGCGIAGFERIPVDCWIYMYHLDLHHQIWVHSSGLQSYQYDEKLCEKLILPQSHRDLIEVLVQDQDVLMGDIIGGKSGGTTILCQGEPGLGKTLTAEAYSERVHKPLLRMEAGQLGIKPDDIEKNLKDILERAERWGCVLLLDEADVYIRRRGDDLHQNAIVASFLRVLEYFHGLFFMTTNRGNDVDDAIKSRCIAWITYEKPSTYGRLPDIWRVLSKQFEISLSEEMIGTLASTWPNLSGRDVRELLKLTARYAKSRNFPLDMDAFRRMAQFRGAIEKQ